MKTVRFKIGCKQKFIEDNFSKFNIKALKYIQDHEEFQMFESGFMGRSYIEAGPVSVYLDVSLLTEVNKDSEKSYKEKVIDLCGFF
jgi:hypothetical protein